MNIERTHVKESRSINKYLDFARELRKLWNMKVKMIPIGPAPKSLEKRLWKEEIVGIIETIQTTVLLRVSRRFQGALLSLRFQEKKTPSKTGVNNS